MGPEGASLEELRANLASFARFRDPKLVEIGLAEGPAELDALLRAWVTQYVSFIAIAGARGQSLAWPHLRAGLFLVNFWLEKGALRFRDGRFAVGDLDTLVRASTELLETVQRVRATRDPETLAALYAKYAPAEASRVPWVQAVAGKADPLDTGVVVVHRPFEIGEGGIAFQGDAERIETLVPYL
jgi:hypothetical protein